MMKKTVLISAIALVTGLTLYVIEARARMGGGHGMGTGMMGRGGYEGWDSQRWGHGIGPGMMGRGYGQQYEPRDEPRYQQPQISLGEKDARAILEDYLSSMRNPNLKLGEIKDRGDAFEAEILTQDNSLVDRVLVDKNTGWMRSAY